MIALQQEGCCARPTSPGPPTSLVLQEKLLPHLRLRQVFLQKCAGMLVPLSFLHCLARILLRISATDSATPMSGILDRPVNEGFQGRDNSVSHTCNVSMPSWHCHGCAAQTSHMLFLQIDKLNVAVCIHKRLCLDDPQRGLPCSLSRKFMACAAKEPEDLLLPVCTSVVNARGPVSADAASSGRDGRALTCMCLIFALVLEAHFAACTQPACGASCKPRLARPSRSEAGRHIEMRRWRTLSPTPAHHFKGP